MTAPIISENIWGDTEEVEQAYYTVYVYKFDGMGNEATYENILADSQEDACERVGKASTENFLKINRASKSPLQDLRDQPTSTALKNQQGEGYHDTDTNRNQRNHHPGKICPEELRHRYLQHPQRREQRVSHRASCKRSHHLHLQAWLERWQLRSLLSCDRMPESGSGSQ